MARHWAATPNVANTGVNGITIACNGTVAAHPNRTDNTATSADVTPPLAASTAPLREGRAAPVARGRTASGPPPPPPADSSLQPPTPATRPPGRTTARGWRIPGPGANSIGPNRSNLTAGGTPPVRTRVK